MNVYRTKNPIVRPGYFRYLCVADVETSGLAYNDIDPSIGFQIVSLGAIIVDADTLEELDSIYLECQWNGESTWSDGAERVHGLSKQLLKERGLPEDQFVAEFADWLYTYYPPDGNPQERAIKFAGQNFRSFDHYFIKNLFNKYNLPLKTGSRFVDTSSLGFAVFGCYDSNELFELIGNEKRSEHNSLDDARQSLEVIRVARGLSKRFVEGLYSAFD